MNGQVEELRRTSREGEAQSFCVISEHGTFWEPPHVFGSLPLISVINTVRFSGGCKKAII